MNAGGLGSNNLDGHSISSTSVRFRLQLQEKRGDFYDQQRKEVGRQGSIDNISPQTAIQNARGIANTNFNLPKRYAKRMEVDLSDLNEIR